MTQALCHHKFSPLKSSLNIFIGYLSQVNSCFPALELKSLEKILEKKLYLFNDFVTTVLLQT